jgi:hypothetical protein
MKGLKMYLGVLLFLVFLPSSFAQADSFFKSYDSMFTVTAPNSTAKKTTFFFDQRPVLFLKYFPDNSTVLNEKNLFTFKSPNGSVFSFGDTTKNDKTWYRPSNSFWDSVKTPGTWTFAAKSFNSGKDFFGKTTFRVNAAPEPLSAVLFLFGAFIMGAAILSRKKALAV